MDYSSMSNNTSVQIQDIHVGHLLKRWLRVHNVTRQQLADAMGTYTSKIGRILSRPTINTETLFHISKVLHFNFFEMFWSDTFFDETGSTLQAIHIGKGIDKHLKSVGMTQKQLAELIGVYYTDITRTIKNKSIDSGKLTAISKALNHNFFLDFYGNYEQLSESTATMAAYYKDRYEKLLLDYERVNRELLDSRTEIARLMRSSKAGINK